MLIVLWHYSLFGPRQSDVELRPATGDAVLLLCFAVASYLLDQEMKEALKRRAKRRANRLAKRRV